MHVMIAFGRTYRSRTLKVCSNGFRGNMEGANTARRTHDPAELFLVLSYFEFSYALISGYEETVHGKQ